MILDGPFSSDIDCDLAVVGAGPAGIVVALEVARAGFAVALIESGGRTFDEGAQSLSIAAEFDSLRHAPLEMTIRRQIGGTSRIWGGRCVPFDPVDFDARPWITNHRWPIGHEDVAPYLARTCEWLRCGRPVFDAREIEGLSASITPGLPNDDVLTCALERWSLPTDFGREYIEALAAEPNLRLYTGLTCTEIVNDRRAERVTHLRCRQFGSPPVEVRARRFVIACGGLESTRLLLASRADGRCVGDHSGHLGRWYMGHVEGVATDVGFTASPDETVYDYERDSDGTYVRRRVTIDAERQVAEELPNVAAWLANPALADASHRSAALSTAYLALVSPLGSRVAPEAQRLSLTGHRVAGAPYGGSTRSPLRTHVKNIARHPEEAARFALGFGRRRLVARGRKPPGFFVKSRRNRYPLQYHAEHLPHWESQVSLADRSDPLGMPLLKIDVRFTDRDIEGVAAAHRVWDAHLRDHGAGSLGDTSARLSERIWAAAGAGFHQAGTTRMSARAEDGVVDEHLEVWDAQRLHIASSSTFVTSSQANSTFMIVALALRLSDWLRQALPASER